VTADPQPFDQLSSSRRRQLVSATEAAAARWGGRSDSNRPDQGARFRNSPFHGACLSKLPLRRILALMRQPTMYLPHGGGPCFFMDWTMGPADTWDRTAEFLRGIAASLPEKPKALLVISAHWEEEKPTVMSGTAPPLLFERKMIRAGSITASSSRSRWRSRTRRSRPFSSHSARASTRPSTSRSGARSRRLRDRHQGAARARRPSPRLGTSARRARIASARGAPHSAHGRRRRRGRRHRRSRLQRRADADCRIRCSLRLIANHQRAASRSGAPSESQIASAQCDAPDWVGWR
jgi:hypothetical protein